uniref:Uncharacterized protein n=1 Tax=uncultured marine thaumarchaeote AD1000_65_A02 TaxID=1455929 RepID=A0A075G0M9_9ARCH|nr:hypothetical protein [uncultured marine thaumarchaeote AD1000_65_A02]
MTCKGICSRYRAMKQHIKYFRYANGQKRCQTCALFIQWEGLWCPCCSNRLRTSPRTSKDLKRKFREMWIQNYH